MRHRNKTNSLGRTASHKKAMLANMATSLVKHKRIKTTLAKAKVLRTYVEPLITRCKNDTTHNRRVVFGYLQDKYAVSELFRDVAPKIGDRPGGYTRILKLGHRMGDNAEICIVELVDFNTTYKPNEKKKKTTRKRTRRAGSKTTENVVEEKVETVVEEKLDETNVAEVVEEVVEEKVVDTNEEIKEEDKKEE
ncbi:MAG: 50S ribosomal protein L17 [Bacteroidales bacterium]|nr:50S ribosomal protein L17 [Bacteroidales bacterium]